MRDAPVVLGHTQSAAAAEAEVGRRSAPITSSRER